MYRALFLAVFTLSSPTLSFAQDPDPAPLLEVAAPVVEVAAPVADEVKAPLPGVEVPTDDEEALDDVQEAVSALQTGQWGIFGVLLFGLLVFGYNKWAAAKAAE